MRKRREEEEERGGGLLCYSLCDSDSVTLAAVTLSLSPDLLRNQQLQLAILLALLLLLLLTHHTPVRLRMEPRPLLG